MEYLITILHVLTCLCLIAIVLLQHGKGADIGVALGGGASQTVFGARGAGSFLTKLTTGAAILFMITSFTLSRMGGSSDVESIMAPASEAPVAPAEVPESSFPEAAPIEQDADAPSGFEAIEPPATETESDKSKE
ncbi:MAG: preprotein translocase subunit SecG [bacterium]|nr:preprotein translocase subunit SecG [bacterium]